MKKQLSRMLCLLLCAVMMLSILPVMQVSAAGTTETVEKRTYLGEFDGAKAYSVTQVEVEKEPVVSSAPKKPAMTKSEALNRMARHSGDPSTAAIGKNEEGDLTFTTFADLKQLASRTYDSVTCIIYAGSASTFTISENLTFPEDVWLYFWNTSVVIPAGVTFTAYDSSFDALTVKGTYVNEGYLYIDSNLTVNGAIKSSGSVVLSHAATLVGANKITFTEQWNAIVRESFPTNATEFATYLNAASKDSSGIEYQIYLWEPITMASAFTIPANTTVYVDESLTINSNCTVNGYLGIWAPVTVKGTLTNNGSIGIDVDEYSKGSLAFASTGKYSGSGELYVNIDTTVSSATLAKIITGLNLDNFDISSYNNGDYTNYNLTYVGNKTRLDAPTGLGIDANGYLYWTNGTNIDNCVQVIIYRNGEQVYSAREWGMESKQKARSESFAYGDWQSGTYYFEAYSVADRENYRNSVTVKSPTWTYTRPSKKFAPCTNVKVNGTTVSWTAPADTTNLGWYRVHCVYYTSETASDFSGRGWIMVEPSATSVDDFNWFLELYGEGWYSFAVQPLTSNVNKAVSGDISEYTDRVYWSTAPLAVPAKPHKIVNVVSGVHVYWNAVKGASKYGVWRSETGKNGTYKWLGNPTVPHFTDTTAVSGKTYYYKVTAVNAGNVHTDKSEAIGITFTSTPDISTRTNIASGIKLGWKKITGATGYAIYRKSYSGTDAWVRIATIDGGDTLTWTDTSVKNNNGEAYKYTIRALYGNTLSGCRNAGRTMVRLSSQVLKSAAKASATSAKCTWTTSSRVTGYEIRFTAADGTEKLFTIGNYKTGTKTFTGLTAGETYTVQVRTYKKVDGVGSFYSDWSTAKTVKI